MQFSNASSAPKPSGAKLEVCKLSKYFYISSEGNDVKTVLDNISFTLEQGSCTVIGGANGSGKTVLMSIIAGLLKQSSGEISISFSDGKKSDSKKKFAGIVFQDADSQILGETPLEDVMYGAVNCGLSKPEAKKAALEALEKVGLRDKAEHPARFLSGGEKRRLAVAGILVMNRPLIIFDEPYANLDYDGVKQVNSLIEFLKGQGKTLIILMHEIEKCLALADRFMILFKGKKVFDGSPKEGIQKDLAAWGIKPPTPGTRVEDLIWK
ncbi:ABC transporter ATP-binding protein [Treponema parvum]|uniref:ABC transporter ATP-binding protein n=1 Tax=Treponema parvum TaxID=138851 RepID=A0A975F075_9SPIR|nr:ABC transporter ATP-binding protein [Treponema parvum]QTQ11664.1 ABC transporter ATP-binding protein [Treponema parvum]